MKLDHIALSNLKPSALNVRKHGGDDVADLLISIRHRGVLQPLLVRPDGEQFEVIAGARRLKACQMLAAERVIDPLPCAIMEDGDDAAAIAASLDENIQRLPMDEIDQYEAFADLRKRGQSVENIASAFGVTERLVRQRLAIANLVDGVLSLYRKDEINGDTMRTLTLATKAQQKAWLKRYRDPDDYAPQGRGLRQWLLGGEQIATSVALFPLENYKGAIVTDLFGEDAYFADPAAFWTLQSDAAFARMEAYRAQGWSDVITLPRGEQWWAYDYVKATRKQGGKVYVVIAHSGEITFHEGYLPERQGRGRGHDASETADRSGNTQRPELTKAAQNYVDLHRHAAVQAALIGNAGMALKVIAAHIIAGSSLWQVRPEPGRADKPATASSIEASTARAAVLAERDEVLAMLRFRAEDEADAPLVNGSWNGRSMAAVFGALMSLDDGQVIRVMTYGMAETLQAGTTLIDTLGTALAINMAGSWQADDAFLDLVANKSTLNLMLKDIGGPLAADAHKASPSKVIRGVIRQYASGEGRQKVEGWLPPYLQFPQGQYEPACPHIDDAAEEDDQIAA